MNNDRIAAIRERCNNASDGPWERYDTPDYAEIHVPSGREQGYPPVALTNAEYNADFIAHAREDIPYLLSQLAERDKELKRLQKEVASLAIESVKRDVELARLEAEVMHLWETQRWTDTEYDTPDIGQAVLLYMPDKETDNIRVGEYIGEGDYRIGNKLYRGMEIDAWLPLPAAPEEGKQI